MIPYLLVFLFLLFFVSSTFTFLAKYFYGYIKLLFAILYPSYKCYKAIKKKDAREHSRWMMYWVCYGIFSAVEFFTDFVIAFWFPCYYELKIGFLLWLISPYAKVFYKSVIHPELNRHEETIDSYLNKATIFSSFGIDHLWRTFSEPLTNALAYGLTSVLFSEELKKVDSVTALDKEMHIEKSLLSLAKENALNTLNSSSNVTLSNEPLIKETMDIEMIIESVLDCGKENIHENVKENALSRENGRLRPKRERKTVTK